MAGMQVLITGIMAAGKSTVAQALAERLPKSVHVRGDLFRRMIVGGRADMSAHPLPEAEAQLALRYRIAAETCAAYRGAGFSVVYQDVILGPWLERVLDLHEQPVHLFVLSPSADVVAEREAARGKVGYLGFTPGQLDRDFRAETPRLGQWLDTSRLTVSETVERILDALPDAALD